MWKCSTLIAAALVVLAAAPSYARHNHDDDDDDRGGDRTLTCESRDGESHYCQTGTTGRVELQRQLSRANCDKYEDWGSDDDGGGIWVRNGCRATFVVHERRWGGWHRRHDDDDYDRDDRRGDDRNQAPQVIRCGSVKWQYNHCDVNGRRWEARMVKQRSGSRCVENESWGQDRSGIWVDKGCEADFEVRR